MRRNKSIGIFDSGFGGLDVLRGALKELPQYDYVYLGDSARVPYGEKSKKAVYNFTAQAVDFLSRKNCDLIILACNTVSSEALRRIQKEYIPKYFPDKKVLGVLIPAAEIAALETKNKKVGVIATSQTVKSKAFLREPSKINPKIKVFQKACPLLVPIVEKGEHDLKSTERVLKKYLRPLIAKKIDALILGCTHYGILEDKIRGIAGKNVKIISQSKILGRKLGKYLKNHPEIEKKLKKNKKISFYTTDPTGKFEVLGSRFFGKKIKASKADL